MEKAYIARVVDSTAYYTVVGYPWDKEPLKPRGTRRL